MPRGVERRVEIRSARGGDDRLPSLAHLGVDEPPGRSSRPPATRASAVASSSASSGACSVSHARTARSESRRNGTSWQRERIVSGSGPSSSATSTIVA